MTTEALPQVTEYEAGERQVLAKLDEFDLADGVRQLAEALFRAQAMWALIPHSSQAEVLEKAECDSSNPHFVGRTPVSLDTLKALCFLLLTETEMPLAVLVGPAAERAKNENTILREAYSESEKDLAITREFYRQFRKDIAEAMGQSAQEPYLATLERIRTHATHSLLWLG
jgi:hypothetical protein